MEILSNFLVDVALLAIPTSFSLNLYNVKKLKDTLKRLENSEQYNRTLQNLNDDVRCFKHDFDNIVTTIGGYVNTDDMEGLKKYYNHLEKECISVNNLYLLNPNIINDSGVYRLLVSKFIKAKKLNIKMSFELLLNMNELKMNIFEFTRILGILLDNAIEASADSKEKVINIYFKNEERNHRQLIVVENSYYNKDVNINNIFNKNETDKQNHSGLGLYKIRKILNKNNNLNLFTTKNKKYFKQQLEIYYT